MKEISTDSLDITVEEFDQMNTQHEFSKEYKRNKKRIIRVLGSGGKGHSESGKKGQFQPG